MRGRSWDRRGKTASTQATITHTNERVSNLWQLFEGPSQFEEFGDVAALRVVLTRAPRLYRKTVLFAAALQCKTLQTHFCPYLPDKMNGIQ